MLNKDSSRSKQDDCPNMFRAEATKLKSWAPHYLLRARGQSMTCEKRLGNSPIFGKPVVGTVVPPF